jgi:hypothetical protein
LAAVAHSATAARSLIQSRRERGFSLGKTKKICQNTPLFFKTLALFSLWGFTDDNDLLQELVDLRLIHHVKSRVTVSNSPGKTFRALLLDFSQYTGERKKRDVDMLEFWKDANKEAIRRKSLIYNPNVSFAELESQIREHSRRNDPGSPESAQRTMF